VCRHLEQAHSEGLLWLSGYSSYSPTHPRAPSWSWAAWEGPVQYPDNLRKFEFVPQAIFESIRERGRFSDLSELSWLAGPGILRIEAPMISLDNVTLTGEHIQIGPGPNRRGYFTSDNKDLPRLGLKQYLDVHTLRGSRNANKRLLVRQDRLSLCGWIALDGHSFAQRQDLSEIPHEFEADSFALLGTQRAPSGGVFYFGVFLVLVEKHMGRPCKYRRIGCGQLSHSFVSGEEIDDWSPREDELVWSTRSDKRLLYIPQDLSTRTTIDIE
jgi:hypothetical protein